jgi:hypothetical protein
VFFTGYSQAKNYKNQINKNLKDNVLIEKKGRNKRKEAEQSNPQVPRIQTQYRMGGYF